MERIVRMYCAATVWPATAAPLMRKRTTAHVSPQAGFTRKKDHAETLLDAARMTPLSPANVLRDVVLPALEQAEIEWRGYHAFRRGLATNLRALHVDDLTI
jgi:hypothetical protein